MAESKVVHKREPNWALLVPILYAPLFPLMRIALKGNPRANMKRVQSKAALEMAAARASAAGADGS